MGFTKFDWTEIKWGTVLTLIGVLTALVTFWEKGGKSIWSRSVTPVAKFIWVILSIPWQLNDIRKAIESCQKELTEDSGKSVKDLMIRNTLDTAKIRQEVTIINQRLRAALSISPHAHWEGDVIGRILWVNRSFTRMIGCTSEELIGWSWLDRFVCDEDRERVRGRYVAAMKNGEDFEMAFSMIREGGEKFKVHAQAHVMRDRDTDQVLGYLGMLLKEH